MRLHLPTCRLIVPCLWLAACTVANRGYGQVTSLADDIILISKGVQNQEQSRADQHLGGDIGGKASALGYSPGSRDVRPGPRPAGASPGASYRMANQDVLQAASGEPQRRPTEELRIRPPQSLPMPPAPFLGALDIPEQDDEGPANGLALDEAMALLVRQNYDLRTKRFEIPQARADVLTASLRANPLVFATASSVPYGSYSPQRPGDNSYSATVIYPFDVSHKRIARTEVAAQASRVIEAQYQDAVRLELDRLYMAFVDVVAARETLRYARANRDGLREVVQLAQRQLDNQQISRPDFYRITIQLESAEIGVEQAGVALRESKHVLGLLLAIPIRESERIEVRGSMRDTAPAAPASDELWQMARDSRPDLTAYRFGVRRAQSDVQLAQAEKTSDVFVLYSPWEFRNNQPVGGQNATSWSMAAFGSVPLFNRNQGNIRRAQLNVSQTRTELAGLEQVVAEEVHSAFVEYEASRDVVNRLEHVVLPRSRTIRDESARLMAQGQTSALDYLAARREHNDVVRQYRDALIRHRRSMLKLNTAVGERILP
jgi:cobalt-zinc-cadmium efflux system outer membrane protein